MRIMYMAYVHLHTCNEEYAEVARCDTKSWLVSYIDVAFSLLLAVPCSLERSVVENQFGSDEHRQLVVS